MQQKIVYLGIKQKIRKWCEILFSRIPEFNRFSELLINVLSIKDGMHLGFLCVTDIVGILLLEKNRRSELNGLFDNFNQIINI